MSEFGKINWKDIGKGFLVAFLTIVIAGVSTSLDAGAFPTLQELGALALTGLGAGVAYLLKNVFTNSDNKLASGEKK